MGYSIRFDDGDSESAEEVFALATTDGLSQLGDWAAGLEKSDALASLLRDGAFAGTDMIASQLKDALDAHAPTDPDVLSTAKNLLDLIGVGDPDEAAIIVDGVNEDAGEGAEDDAPEPESDATTNP